MDENLNHQLIRTIVNCARNDASCKSVKALCAKVKQHHPEADTDQIRRLVFAVGSNFSAGSV